jgi:hypothetical protein
MGRHDGQAGGTAHELIVSRDRVVRQQFAGARRYTAAGYPVPTPAYVIDGVCCGIG